MNHYIQAIHNGLDYWQRLAGELDDAAVAALDRDRFNLHQLLEEGLRLEATQQPTAELMAGLGHFIETRGYWEEWLPLLERAIATCADSSDPVAPALQARLLYSQGYFLAEKRGRYEEAVAALQTARQVAQTVDNRRLVAETLFFLGEIQRQMHRYNAASRYAREALALFRQQPASGSWAAATLNCLGNIAENQGEYDTAVQYLTESVALWRQDHRTVRLARVLRDLAIAYTGTGNIEQAHTCLAEAYRLVINSPNELDKIRFLVEIGVVYYRQKAWTEAAEAFRQANTPYLQNSPDLIMRAKLANNLGNVLYKQHRQAGAEAYLRQAIPLWRTQNDDLELGNSLGSLGKVLVAQAKKEEAAECFAEAITLLAQFPQNQWANKLLAEFCDCQQRLWHEDEEEE
jgi:tetratricopeptide (TPR) repeat protein